MPERELRHATFEDVDDVYALMCELKQAEFDRDAFYTGFAANLQDKNLHHANWIGEIQELVVMPGARGSKVGSLLLAWAEETAREAGAEMTELSTSTKRLDAHRFYQREGYAPSHVRFTKAL